MKKLYRYIFLRLFSVNALVLLACIILYALIDALMIAGDLVKDMQGIILLLQYILVRVPFYIYQMAPLVILVGSAIALMRFVRNYEYVVMRVNGISLFRMALLMWLFAMMMGGVSFAIGEYLLMPSAKLSQQMLVRTKTNKVSLLGKHNVWVKSKGEIVELWQVLPDYSLKNVLRYQLDEDNELKNIKYSLRGVYLGHNTWRLEGISNIHFSPRMIEKNTHSEEIWHPDFNMDLLSVLLSKPTDLSIKNLHSYINYLKRNQQKVIDYELTLWKKFFYPFALGVMVLIALVFTPLISRYSNEGLKLVLSILVGVTYFFFLRFFSFFTDLTFLPPLISAVLPTLIFYIALWVVLYYQERGRLRA